MSDPSKSSWPFSGYLVSGDEVFIRFVLQLYKKILDEGMNTNGIEQSHQRTLLLLIYNYSCASQVGLIPLQCFARTLWSMPILRGGPEGLVYKY